MNKSNDNQLFIDPYADLPPEAFLRANVDIPIEAWNFIKSLSPYASDRPTTLRILINRLINELKRNGITQYNPDDTFHRAVGGLTISLGSASSNDPRGTGSAVAITGTTTNPNLQTLEAVNRNDRPGTGGVSLVAPQTPSQPTRVEGSSGRKRTGGKRGISEK